MTSTTVSQRHLDAVEHALLGSLQSRRDVAERYGATSVRLWELVLDTSGRGKRVRPQLFLDAYAAMAPAPDAATSRALAPVGAAIELLHLAFLLHDDVIDGDLVRHGRPNLAGALLADALATGAPRDRALHWARSGAVLAGDVLLSEAHLVLARLDLAPGRRDALIDLLQHTIAESVAGELLDVALGDRLLAPDLVTVLSSSRFKTATYSFELPLRAAGILAGCGQRTDRELVHVGRMLGLIFQLQDDLLSAFGDPDEHGKEPYSDLREGKETAIIAMARASGHWHHIAPLFQAPDPSPSDLAELSRLLDASGARDAAAELLRDEIAVLRSLLSRRDTGGVPGRVVLDLLDTLERRTR